jgi:hypothetical protein
MKYNFTILLILIISQLQAQNCHKVEEIVLNRHEPNGHTKNHPYTLFDRHNSMSIQETIDEIRKRV